MDWILFIAIAYSMVGVSLAGFVSANKRRRYSHLLKCEFYHQTSSLFHLDCHFHAIYVTLLHINVHFKPYTFCVFKYRNYHDNTTNQLLLLICQQTSR